MTEPIKKVEKIIKTRKQLEEECYSHECSCRYLLFFSIDQVEELLHQQAAETRLATIEECAETFRKETEGVCHAACNKPLYLGTVYEKLKSLKEQTN